MLNEKRNNILKLTEADLEQLIIESIIDILQEGKDRSEYWKARWAKQKEEGSVPDRSEYWKNRAKKQKTKHSLKRKKDSGYRDYLERLDAEDDAMDMMTDNDWGEYFGDHE